MDNRHNNQTFVASLIRRFSASAQAEFETVGQLSSDFRFRSIADSFRKVVKGRFRYELVVRASYLGWQVMAVASSAFPILCHFKVKSTSHFE